MIAGWFDGPVPLPFVEVAVTLPRLSDEWRTIRFLVDTGAARTAVSVGDAVGRLNLSPRLLRDRSAWPRLRRAGGVGGSAVYFEIEARFAFRHVDGSMFEFSDQIWIAEARDDDVSLPSLLGWNVLARFRIAIDPSLRSIALDPL